MRRPKPSAARTTDGVAFESFSLERETKADGRGILFYSWPDEPEVPAGLGNVSEDAGTDPGDVAPGESSPETEPWSPETQPVDPAGRDV